MNKKRGFLSPKKAILLKNGKSVVKWKKSGLLRTGARLSNSTKYCFFASNRCTLGKTPSEAPFYEGKKWVGVAQPSYSISSLKPGFEGKIFLAVIRLRNPISSQGA